MRYLKITLSGLALFLVYLWIAVLFNSCKNNKPAPVTSEETELLEEEMGGSEFGESEFEGETSTDSESMNSEETTQTENASETESYETEQEYTPPVEKTKLEPKTSTKTFTSQEKAYETDTKTSNPKPAASSSSSSSGDYMVIAGSFLLEENAKKNIQKLQKMGYSNAEIVYFNQSQYHSICVGRYASQSTAKQTAQTLKGKGIDSYVHKKQD